MRVLLVWLEDAVPVETPRFQMNGVNTLEEKPWPGGLSPTSTDMAGDPGLEPTVRTVGAYRRPNANRTNGPHRPRVTPAFAPQTHAGSRNLLVEVPVETLRGPSTPYSPPETETLGGATK